MINEIKNKVKTTYQSKLLNNINKFNSNEIDNNQISLAVISVVTNLWDDTWYLLKIFSTDILVYRFHLLVLRFV